MERAVVLAAGAAGLRAGSWLAARGVAVRWLGVGAIPTHEPWPAAVRGDRDALQALLGPVIDVAPARALLLDGELHPVPRRRRDLVRLCGIPRPVDGARWLARAALSRRRAGTLEAWCTAHLGSEATRRLALPYAEARLGGGAAGLAAGQARMLFGRGDGGGWWASTAEEAEAWAEGRREAILDVGGELLEHVAVDHIEVDDRRIVAVHTEFGRELVDDRLFTDLTPSQLLALLPPEARPAGLAREVASLPARHAVRVRLRAEAHGLPWVVHVCDVDRPGFRIARVAGTPGMPRPDCVDVQLAVAGSDPAWTDDAAAVQAALVTTRGVVEALADPASVTRTEGAHVRCSPGAEAAVDRALGTFEELGLVPLGPRALHAPLDLDDEHTWLTRVLAGEGLGAVRRALIAAGSRSRPWTAVPD